MTVIDEDDYLAHYGIARKSGRYPWGSGGTELSRSKTFLDHLATMRAEGLSDVEIARGLGMTTTQLRDTNTMAKNAKKRHDIATAQKYKDKGMGNVAIAERMGINESSVRALLAPGVREKADILNSTAEMLRREVDRKGMIDVGKGVENTLGISDVRLRSAVSLLESEGYFRTPAQIPQVGTRNKTTTIVLAKPGTTYRDVAANIEKLQSITSTSENGGRTFNTTLPPLSLSSKRVAVAYKEDGGADADGVIFVRPGKEDISLGGSRYAQVRIMVDGTHYLKGMAMYKDDLPDGVDLVFNTNKSKKDPKIVEGGKLAAMKDIKNDDQNPFGAVYKQIGEYDANGSLTKVTSVMNLVNKEGDWDGWRKSLSSQVLSKQKPQLAKQQLDEAFERKKNELDAIMSLTNPAVKKKLLDSYADGADSSAVHLKAAALPRQRAQVILPLNSLKDTEIYAPNFRDGERVALIRYPHGGIFEIPELTVNNRHPEGKRLIGPLAKDAVAINSKVAERLSGADFDGDTVLVIPNNSGSIKTKPALEGLKGFDPQSQYKLPDSVPRMKPQTKGTQMGLVSNLITDMTIKGASDHELAAAVRHSMVVIDAEKHHLDYKQSAIDNGIPNLMRKYQGRSTGGSDTLISRATSSTQVVKRKLRPASQGGPVDPATGKKVYVDVGKTYVNKQGKTVTEMMKSTKLAETDDANTLSSGTPIEKVYADYSNRMKALANTARKESLRTQSIPYDPSARKVYDAEVKTLNAKLNTALKNSPRERQAQVIANAQIAAKRQANPHMDDDELKKVRSQALRDARNRMGASKQQIVPTAREWEAIQAGAITNNKLKEILNNADLDKVKELAMPRPKVLMTSAKQAQAKRMADAGYTQAEIADHLGVSLTTLKEGLG